MDTLDCGALLRRLNFHLFLWALLAVTVLVLLLAGSHVHAAPLAIIGLGTNVLAPTGFQWSRNKSGSSIDMSMRQYQIAFNYGTAIGIGDPVQTVPGGGSGLIQLATSASTAILGIFMGVDLLSGNFNPGAALLTNQNNNWPAGGFGGSQNLNCWVIDDPQAVFRAQVGGNTNAFSQAWRGLNANPTAGSTGVPNASGISTASINPGSIATTATLLFRVMGVIGVIGTPQDPTAINPWIEVAMNPGACEALSGTGV